MSNPPLIVIIGGSANQVKRIRAITLERFMVLELPGDFNQQMQKIKALSGEALIFLFDHPQYKSQQRLKRIKANMPDTPVVMVGRRPTRKHIISAFRRGADDFLIWPFEEKEVLRLLEQYQPAAGSRRRQRLKKWWNKLKMILHWPASSGHSPHASAQALGIAINRPYMTEAVVDQKDQCDLCIRFFGRLEVFFRGKKMKPIPGKKVNSVFAYLLYHHNRPIHREKLMACFWGSNTPSSARNSLNVAIHTIRKHFQKICPHQEIVLYRQETYVLNPELDILTDTDQFSYYWQKGRDIEARQGLESAMGAYHKAVALYRGDFLEDMLYEEWCESARDSLMETYLLTLDRLSTYFLQEGSYTASINICKKILAKDECLEDGHRRLIICYDRLGMRDKAIRQYHKCARILKNELSVEPSDETKEIFVEISEG